MDRRALLRLEVPLGLLGFACVAGAVVFAVSGVPAWIPPAPLVRAGVPSPLTGMTRSFVAVVRGDVGAAFLWHPLGPLVFAVCVGAAAMAAISVVRGTRSELVGRILGRRALWYAVAVAFAAVWVRQIVVIGG